MAHARVFGAYKAVTAVNAIQFLASSGNIASGTIRIYGVAKTGSPGGGDLTGPASAVDDRIVTFDGTTGKLVQDSGKLLPTGDVVGTSDSQTLTAKTFTTPIVTSYTVAGLPAAGTAGRVAVVTDASTAGSCTSGGGSAVALCRDSGAAWVPLGDGGSNGTVDLATGVTGTLPVANGGTGATTLTANGVLYGNGTSAVAATGTGTAGQVLTSNGSGSPPTFQAAPAGGGFSYWTTATSANVSSTVRTVTGATAGSPTTITATSHGFATGTRVWVTGVGGITGINDQLWVVTNTGTNTFTLDGSNGAGTYTSGGTAAGSGTQVFTMLGRAFTSTRAAAEIKAPVSQTVTYMSLRTGAGVVQSAVGPMICSLWVAGSRSSLSVTVPASTGTSIQVTPGTGSVSITQGDNVAIGCENFASGASTDTFYIALF